MYSCLWCRRQPTIGDCSHHRKSKFSHRKFHSPYIRDLISFALANLYMKAAPTNATHNGLMPKEQPDPVTAGKKHQSIRRLDTQIVKIATHTRKPFKHQFIRGFPNSSRFSARLHCGNLRFFNFAFTGRRALPVFSLFRSLRRRSTQTSIVSLHI
jgi:hypothetical protein